MMLINIHIDLVFLCFLASLLPISNSTYYYLFTLILILSSYKAHWAAFTAIKGA